MGCWLAKAVKLAAIRNSEQLIEEYVAEIQEELGLLGVYVLMPSPDGRTLATRYDSQELVWAVDDFEHPFSHVLQAPAPMLLDEDKRVYWLSNAAFCSLVVGLGKEDSILIQPLPPDDPHVRFIVVFMGSSIDLEQLQQKVSWLEFSKFFALQWQMLVEIDRQLNQQSALTESITRIRQEERNREMSLELRTQLIGRSETMQQVREQVVTAAQSDLTVLIQGETGTGKELAAVAVHTMSSRSDKPFIAINCAAIPENLLESELFGHERGAFSGAETAKKGLLAEAHGGTLFLDEIGDMPLMLHAKLLRMLETRKFRPVGARDEIDSDFRLVAATHVHLRERVENREFRSDLYYRLNQYPLLLPSLSERKEDLLELILHFIEAYNHTRGSEVTGIRYAALELLNEYDFPGNVRELRNIVEYACAQTPPGEEIGVMDFDGSLFQNTKCVLDSDPVQINGEQQFAEISNLKKAIMHYETAIIKSRLAQFDGNRAMTAISLNVPKRTLAHKCLKLEIQ